jgi:tetratricopeptide (TPR) repeat protein
MTGRRLLKTCLVALPLAAWVASEASAVQGVIVQKDKRRRSGDIRWLTTAKQYEIRAKGVSMRVDPSLVERIDIPEPPALKAAIGQVRAGSYSVAIEALEKIMLQYRMLNWDVVATRYAARAYLELKQPKKAIMMCKRLIDQDPQLAYKGEVAEIYWEALVADDKAATLEKILKEAIGSGSRELAALAQIRRGDIQVKQGRHKEALIDGYLRTVLLFENVQQYQPEALYKAADCFDQINDAARAEKMRKTLLAEYPQSEYAKKARRGR